MSDARRFARVHAEASSRLSEPGCADRIAGESDLRNRIAAVIARMNDCWCEDCNIEPDEFDLMVADAVIRELEADYILVPKGHTIARIRSAEKLGLTGDGE